MSRAKIRQQCLLASLRNNCGRRTIEQTFPCNTINCYCILPQNGILEHSYVSEKKKKTNTYVRIQQVFTSSGLGFTSIFFSLFALKWEVCLYQVIKNPILGFLILQQEGRMWLLLRTRTEIRAMVIWWGHGCPSQTYTLQFSFPRGTLYTVTLEIPSFFQG